MPGIFVTGTGTDVGKSVVTAGLLRSLRLRGRDAAVMKPFQTGCSRDQNGEWIVPDLEFALEVSGWQPDASARRDLCVYAYEPACSPHLAARMAGEEPRVEAVVDAAHRVSLAHELVIAEGAGGILVPVNEQETMLDVMKALAWPVLLVSRSGLGTINDTLLSVAMLRAAGLECLGVVFCDSQPTEHDFIYEDNPKAIAQFGNVEVLGRVPYLGEPLELTRLTQSLSRAADACADTA